MIGFAVSRPAVVWAACAAILAAGAMAFARLPLATRAAVELPRLQVTAAWPGASPELVEMYITAPLEGAVQGVRGVRRVNSTSTDGGARLDVELERHADVRLARLAIFERIELLRADFPPGATVPQVSNFVPRELEEEPLVRLELTGPYTPGTLEQLLEERVRPRIAAVPGVAAVQGAGRVEVGASVQYDAALLRQLGIPPQRLADAVREARVVRALGQERLGPQVRPVALRDAPASLDALADLPIVGAGGKRYRLGDLASVRGEEDTRGQFFRINGQPAIVLTVARHPDADAIRTAARIRAAAAEAQRGLPAGARLRVASDESRQLRRELDDLVRRGAIAFVAVLAVLAATLRRVRAVALVMGATAVAIAGTALGLFLLEVPANLLTLAGLGMGVGILVQNALVVVERLQGAPRDDAARAAAARRMAAPILGATLTTAVVLFPFLYLQGNARAAFVPFAAAFLLALAWSVLTALTVVPAIGLGAETAPTRWRRLGRGYAWLVVRLLRWRWATLAVTLAALGVLSWGFYKKVPRFSWGGAFGPQRTTLSVHLSFPRGSDPEALDRAIREFERLVVGRPEVERVLAQSFGPFGAGMQVLFSLAGARTTAPLELQETLTGRAVFVGGASVSVQGQGPGFSSGGGGGSLASFRLRVLGYSYDGVERLARDLQTRLERIPRVRDVNINATSFFSPQRSREVTIEPDRGRLAGHGVTVQQLAAAVAREVRGSAGRQVLEIGGDEMPVTIKARGARDRSLDELAAAIVPTPSGAPLRIGDLALVGEREAVGTISREDQQYVRIVAYDFRGPARLARRTTDAFLASITAPPGYSVSEAAWGFGPDDTSAYALWLVFAVGVVLVVLSVAVVFDSAWATAMVFLALPVALGGVMGAFWATGAAFTREAAVGLILVVGLAVNQSILLVDGALARRRAGRRLGALAVVGATRERAGMIVLVTLTTLASLAPLSIGTDSDSLFGGIALATAGGTVAGTLGALVVLPAAVVVRTRRRRGGEGRRAEGG